MLSRSASHLLEYSSGVQPVEDGRVWHSRQLAAMRLQPRHALMRFARMFELVTRPALTPIDALEPRVGDPLG